MIIKKEDKCKKIELKYIWRKYMENGSKEKKTNSSQAIRAKFKATWVWSLIVRGSKC